MSRSTRQGYTFFFSRKRGNEGALWGEKALEFTFRTPYICPSITMPELVQKRIKFKLRIKVNHKYSTVLLTFFLSLFSCFQMMKELAKMNGAEIQNLYLFQSISPLVIRKWEKIFCETYYLIWWGKACLKKTLAYLYSWVREHNYVIILGGEVGVLPIMAYTGRLHPKGFPFLGHVAAAWKRSQQHCLTLTPNKNWNNIERMTCHCFLRTIRRDLPSSSYTTAFFRL